MSKKKIFLLIFFIFFLTNANAKQLTNNVIVSIDNSIITDLDINKEINFLKFITVSAFILVVFLSCHRDGRFCRRRHISLFDSLQESSTAVLQQGQYDGIPQNDGIISTWKNNSRKKR